MFSQYNIKYNIVGKIFKEIDFIDKKKIYI